MLVNLSIKNVPDHVVERLRARAERNDRSLPEELMVIIEAAAMENRSLTPAEVLAEVRKLGLSSPSESTAIIRADRDSR